MWVAALVGGAASAGAPSHPGNPGGDPLHGSTFYVPPADVPGTASEGANQAAWDIAHNTQDGRPRSRIPAADLGAAAAIAATPQAIWLGQDFDGAVGHLVDAYETAATAQHRLPVFVLYSIPSRDCGSGFSSGGSRSVARYVQFVRQVESAIDGRPVLVDVEPDASVDLMNGTDGNQNGCDDLTGGAGFDDVDPRSAGAHSLDPLNTSGTPVTYGTERQEMLAFAMKTLAAEVHGERNATVYLDAGQPYSGGAPAQTVAKMAAVLRREGIGYGEGFAVDTSAAVPTAASEAYGDALSNRLRADGVRNVRGASPHYVVDTSRNGNVRAGEPGRGFCNLPGLAIGARPTTDTGDRSGLDDAYLWLKGPGYSDGRCTGDGVPDGNAPSSGTFWACYAEGLYAGRSPMPYPAGDKPQLPSDESAYPCDYASR